MAGVVVINLFWRLIVWPLVFGTYALLSIGLHDDRA